MPGAWAGLTPRQDLPSAVSTHGNAPWGLATWQHGNLRAVRLLMQRLRAPSTSVPDNKSRAEWPSMTQPQRSHSICNVCHWSKSPQAHTDSWGETFTTTLGGQVARSHSRQKSLGQETRLRPSLDCLPLSPTSLTTLFGFKRMLSLINSLLKGLPLGLSTVGFDKQRTLRR